MWRALLILFTVVCLPALGHSQEASLSESQRALLSQAREAMEASNPGLAQSLLQQALEEQPIQSICLRLAVLYAEQARCAEAGELLRRAEQEPADIAAEDFAMVKQTVEEALRGQCVLLEPECVPADLELEIVEGERVSCTDGPFWVSPGERMVVFDFDQARRKTATLGLETGAIAQPRFVSITAWRDAVGEARRELGAAIPVPETPPAQEIIEDVSTEGPSVMALMGWSSLGLGAVSLVTGAAFALELASTNEDARALAASGRFDAGDADRTLSDAKFFETVQFSAYGLSAVFLATGAVLLWLDKEEEVAFVPWGAPDGFGAAWVVPWR